MDIIAEYTKQQHEINESIRSAYGFVKYTERIKDEAPWAYKIAYTRWLEKIEDGTQLMKKVVKHTDLIQLATFSSRFVSSKTEMKQRVYSEMCAQGPCDREAWEFPWEYKTSDQAPSGS